MYIRKDGILLLIFEIRFIRLKVLTSSFDKFHHLTRPISNRRLNRDDTVTSVDKDVKIYQCIY